MKYSPTFPSSSSYACDVQNTTKTPMGKAERTYQEILESAHSLFIHQGYHGTSMRQIANDASVALGSIYNHFTNKEEIFHAVFLANHPYHKILPYLLSKSNQNIETFIQDSLLEIVSTINYDPGFLNLMFIEIVEFNGSHVRELFTQVYPLAQQIILSLSQSNPRMKPFPPLIILRVLMGLFLTYYMTDIILVPAGPAEFKDNAIKYFTEIILHGILSVQSSKVNTTME